MTLKRIILAAAIAGQLAAHAGAQTVWSVPYIGDRVIYVDTVADMVALPAGKLSDGTVVVTSRYSTSHTAGDGSGNVYAWDDGSSATADGGFVITDTGGRWVAKFQDAANLRAFGALGDGSTDDSTTVQAALDSGALLVTANSGTYMVEGLTVSTNNLVIDLRGATLKQKAKVGNPPALITQESQNLTIRHTQFDGNKSNITSGTFADSFSSAGAGRVYGAAIGNDSSVSAYDGLTVENCAFANMYGGCVITQDAENIVVRDCRATSCNFEILWAVGTTGVINNIELSGCDIRNIGSGHGSINANASLFRDVTDLRILNNYFDTVERNFAKIGGNSSYTITNALVANNIGRNVTVAEFAGFQIQDNTVDVSILNNHILEVDTGVNCEESGTTHTNLRIEGNTINCNSTATTGDGIRVTRHPVGLHIERNKVLGFDRYGIRVDASAANADDVRIRDNFISSANAEVAILLQATAGNIQADVSGNRVTGMASAASLGCVRMVVDASDTYFFTDFRFTNNYIEQSATTHRALWCPEPGAFSGDCVFSGNYFGGVVLMCTPAGNVVDLPVYWADDNRILGSATIPAVHEFAAADATPSVRYGHEFITANTGATTITALDDGVKGKTVLVMIGDGNTTIDFTGTTLTGNGGADWSPANGDAMRCTFDGTNWRCQVIDCTP